MRRCGILLHITSLPSKYGIGTFGKDAYDFVDFLHRAHQSYWQVLPLGPTSYGDSPYQTFSAFAGNPNFIDLDILKEEGLLCEEDLLDLDSLPSDYVDYAMLYNKRFPVLYKAYENFINKKDTTEFLTFCEEELDWLSDYAIFMALKKHHHNQSLQSFIKDYPKNSENVKNFVDNNLKEIFFWKFLQFKFFEQWYKLKSYANSLGIKIIGDMPIYVSSDSADVWSNPLNFQLDKDFKPTRVAGCPPDYFSKDGQLWGNPLYNYDYMKKHQYKWWIKRLKMAFKMYDTVRIDHFRGFDAFWSIPSSDLTAVNGKWVKGPGMNLFKEVKKQLGNVDIIAEDLGVLTPSVYKLLKDSGFPGMKVLQFGMSPKEDNMYQPHNYISNCVCYTGTHDNMTTKQWLDTLDEEELSFVKAYCNITEDYNAVHQIIKSLLSSVANLCIIPFADYLQLGSEARFNTPSTSFGNWQWRIGKWTINDEFASYIARMVDVYRRYDIKVDEKMIEE